MKKLLFSAALVAVSLSTFAQSASLGFKGGINFATLSTTSSNGNLEHNSSSLKSFSAGAFLDLKFGSWSIQPAAIYTGKGGKEDYGNGNTTELKLYYLQVPLNFVYHVPVAVGKFYLGAGPYASFGLSGKSKIATNNVTVTSDVNFGDGSADIKSTEFGVNGIAGVEFDGGFLLGLNYDLGLSDISNNTSNSTKTRVFGISAGFKF